MRRKRNNQADIAENRERWLLTYADLITLLLAFFVIMYSMSQLDAKKFGAVSAAFTGILQGSRPGRHQNARDAKRGGGVLKTGRLRLVHHQLQERVSLAGMTASVSAEVTERGLVVHVREGALFTEAKADLTPGACAILSLIGEQIRDVPNHVRIEGHTDARPIATPRFPSNWELSAARATAVLRYLIDSTGFSPMRISASGYGEFRPVTPNASVSQMARNRRVDVVVLSDEMSRSEPQPPFTLGPEVVFPRETVSADLDGVN